jgi:surface antigen
MGGAAVVAQLKAEAINGQVGVLHGALDGKLLACSSTAQLLSRDRQATVAASSGVQQHLAQPHDAECLACPCHKQMQINQCI